MTHCTLTEPSLMAHARKGREGKGKERAGTKSPCIVTLVTRGIRSIGADHTKRDGNDAWLAPLAGGLL